MGLHKSHASIQSVQVKENEGRGKKKQKRGDKAGCSQPITISTHSLSLSEVKEDSQAWRNNALCGNCSQRLYSKCPMFRCDILICKDDATISHLEEHSNPNSATRSLLEELKDGSKLLKTSSSSSSVHHLMVKIPVKRTLELIIDDVTLKLGTNPLQVTFEGYSFDFFLPKGEVYKEPVFPERRAAASVARNDDMLQDFTGDINPQSPKKAKLVQQEEIHVEEEEEEDKVATQTPPPAAPEVRPAIKVEVKVEPRFYSPYVERKPMVMYGNAFSPYGGVKLEPGVKPPINNGRDTNVIRSLEMEGRNLDRERLNLLIKLRLAGVASEEDKEELQELTASIRKEDEENN